MYAQDEGTPCNTGLTAVTVSMFDNYGDGWNGNVLSIGDAIATLETGTEGVATLCIDLSSCTAITVGGGSWGSEVSWTISEDTTVLLYGGAPYDGSIGDCGEPVTFCDGEWVEEIISYDCSSFNSSQAECVSHAGCWFEANAYVGIYLWEDRCYGGNQYSDNSYCDGELVILGCTDPEYVEYNPEANVNDDSCNILAVYGCTDGDYIEYNSAANIDDGSCEYAEISGCTDSEAINYDPTANTDDGSCSFESNSDCENIYITLNNGWNMIGFACSINTDANIAFGPIQDKIILVKDAVGNAYLPDFDFNGIGDLERGYGYLMKVSEEINNYSICE